ncbi:MAG: hypothetical protein ACNA8G_09420 [Gammaproteobacteria bacterium]
MLRNFLAEPYYSEMRTRQQLGYIVASFTTESEQRLYARFLVQSADYTADELRRRSEAFVASLPQLFDALPDEQFEVIRSAPRAISPWPSRTMATGTRLRQRSPPWMR